MAIFRWTGQASSDFGAAGNWYDVTTGAPASVVPGQSDEALVAAVGSIGGNLDVFQLALTGTATALSVTGLLQADLAYLGGTVTLAPNAALYA